MADPIHKSHLNALTGDYGCPRAFKYQRDAAADGAADDEARCVNGYLAAGTATHETIARALTHPDLSARLLGGGTISPDAVKRVYWDEWDREVDGRSVRWRDADKPDALHADRVAMIHGLLSDLHKYVARVELVEAGFIVQVGDYWLSGHIDLVYRPRSNPSALAMADWKTGATKPIDLELDHGWEAGVYCAAVERGLFMPRELITRTTEPDGRTRAVCGVRAAVHASRYIAERMVLEAALVDLGRAVDAGTHDPTPDVRAFSEYPAEIYHVHLADYVPYVKAGTRRVHRPEDLRHYGYDGPTQHKYVAGERRGPAWLPVRITRHDVPRLESRLRNVIGMVRMGRFVDQVGEKCRRCPWASDCLTSGYEARGDERTALERMMTRDAEAAAADLSLD